MLGRKMSALYWQDTGAYNLVRFVPGTGDMNYPLIVHALSEMGCKETVGM